MMMKMRKIHKYAGLVLSVIVILTAVTGILLIHKRALRLNSIHLDIPGYASSLPPDVLSIHLTDKETPIAATKHGVFIKENGEWILTLAENTKKLYKKGTDIYACSKNGLYLSADGRTWQKVFSGHESRAIAFSNEKTYMATTQGIYSKAPQDDLWGAVIDFPKKSLDVRDITLTENGILIAAKEGIFFFQENKGLAMENIIIKKTAKVELQKLISDLHTGEFFGSYFYLIMDTLAIGLIALSVTGIYIWWRPKRSSTKENKKR